MLDRDLLKAVLERIDMPALSKISGDLRIQFDSLRPIDDVQFNKLLADATKSIGLLVTQALCDEDVDQAHILTIVMQLTGDMLADTGVARDIQRDRGQI